MPDTFRAIASQAAGVNDPDRFAWLIRRCALEMTHRSGASHIGSVFSCAEVLAVLYTRFLRVRPEEPDWPERDRFILSKGHAAAGLYAALALRGFFPLEELAAFDADFSRLPGHASRGSVPGVEFSTGSLGHGLPVACGMALDARMRGRENRTVVLLGDGELDEGSVWEAALMAAQLRLHRLIAIVDRNRIQSMGPTEAILPLEPLADKWRAFGWAVQEVPGHDTAAVEEALRQADAADCPTVLLAQTEKGHGVSFMANEVLWHYRSPQGGEYAAALAELNAAWEAMRT